MTSINQDKLNELFDYVEGIVEAGNVPAAQIALGHEGELAGMRTFGIAHHGTSVEPARDDSLFCMFSSTKAVVGIGVWKLLDEGLLDLDERVVDIIPGWCAEGNGEASYADVTVRNVMLHTGGFPHAPMNPRLWEDREARLQRMMGWRLNWTPDTQWEYHATSAHWVLAEIINQKTGEDFRDWLRSNLLSPMGMDNLFVGLPDEEHGRAASIVYTEEPLPVDGGEVFPQTILHFNLASQRRAGCPGGGAFANAADVAMFYQNVINPSDDGPLSKSAIELGTTVMTNPDRHTDPLSGIHVNRALTVVLAGDDGLTEERGFGTGASPGAFGHAGAGGQIAWGDPETGLSVGFLTNGFQQEENVRERTSRIGTMAAACVE